MQIRFLRVSLLGCLLLSAVVSLAQDACPTLVEQVLETTADECSGLDRNEACYGNADVAATPQSGVSDFEFEKTGDIASITDIAELELSALNTPDEWGVALLNVQANLPESLPGQNVTMVLFGEVTLQDQGVAELTRIEMKIRKNARVRSGPGTEYQQVGSVRNGDVVFANARNEAATWVRIEYEGGLGWVLGDTTSAQGPVSALAVLDTDHLDDEYIDYAPMQAFYFSSGIGSPSCDEAPLDGILIQTPEGSEVELVINEARLTVGSTIFLRSQADAEMTVDVVEGQVRAAVAGRTVIAPAGTQIIIPTDENGLAAGTPELDVYDDDDVAALPISLLPDEIEIAEALSQRELEEVLLKNRTPLDGDWRLLSASCGERLGEIIPITFKVDGTELTMGWFGTEMGFSQVQGGEYSDGVRGLYVLSPDYIESQNTSNGCSISLERLK